LGNRRLAIVPTSNGALERIATAAYHYIDFALFFREPLKVVTQRCSTSVRPRGLAPLFRTASGGIVKDDGPNASLTGVMAKMLDPYPPSSGA